MNYKERLEVKHEGKVDTVAIAIYLVSGLAIAGLIVYGTDLFTYIQYGV